MQIKLISLSVVSTKTHFETETNSNSEMVHWLRFYSYTMQSFIIMNKSRKEISLNDFSFHFINIRSL